MQVFRSLKLPAIVGLFAAMAFSASAFEVDGFRSNMSPDEALAIAHKTYPNDRLDKMKSVYGGIARIDIFEAPKKYRDEFQKRTLSFCKGKLVEFRRYFPIRVDRLTQIVSEMSAKYGRPVMKTESKSKEYDDKRGGLKSSEYHDVTMQFDAGNKTTAHITIAQITFNPLTEPTLFSTSPRGSVDVFQVYTDEEVDKPCKVKQEPPAEAGSPQGK